MLALKIFKEPNELIKLSNCLDANQSKADLLEEEWTFLVHNLHQNH